MSKLINLNGNLVELNKLCAIVINENGYFDSKLKSNQMKFIFKNRKEYIFNPVEHDYELITISDEFVVDYPDYETCVTNYEQIKLLWEEALE